VIIVTTFQAKQRDQRSVTSPIMLSAVTMTSALELGWLERPKGRRFAILTNENIQDLYGCQG
jgi:hypothetical protein